MNILITGIHGFVGNNLVKKLSKNHTLYGLDIVNPIKEGVVTTFKWADLDKIEFPSVDTIIHLAGKAHDTNNQSDSNEYFEVNVELTKLIFDFFLISGASKFIFFSTVKAAADIVIDEVLTENIDPSPRGPYGESKLAAEKYILHNFDLNSTQTKHIYILRPCMIHGPGNKGNLNILFNVIRKGIPWPLGSFDNKRSFTSVDNLCYIVENLASRDIPSGIYNICDDETLSTNELIEVMCWALEKKVRIWHIPKRIMQKLAILGSVLYLPLNSERLRKLTENYIVSNLKIKKALGIKQMPISAKEGLIRTLKSFNNRL